jgi:DNA polymerase alpha subunit A
MSKSKSRAAALAQLRSLRESGKSRLSTYEVQDSTDIYEEVDEDGYKKVVRDRLNQDDFVIDDNGEGYADDGREEWHTEQRGSGSESEDERPLKGKAAKRKREEERERKERIDKGINKYFSNATAPVVAKAKVKVSCIWSLWTRALLISAIIA